MLDRIEALEKELARLKKHNDKRGQLLKGLRDKHGARFTAMDNNIANLRRDVERLGKRMTTLTPKGADRVLRTYEQVSEWTLPMQQKINTKTEVSKYLDAAAVPDNKYREFDRAWCWAVDNWSDQKWREQGNQTLDSLLGILITEHRAWLARVSGNAGKT